MLTTIIDEIKENKAYIYDKTEINHIVNVFRMKIGDEIRAIDFKNEYSANIIEISKKMVVLDLVDKKENIYDYGFNLDIAIGVLKNDKMNLLIQKLTEIGVNKIIPLVTKRTVAKVDSKKEKWDLIIKESLKQCKGIKKVEINEILKIENIEYGKYDIIIYAFENSQSSLKIKDILKNKTKNILCIIGPEGGFDLSEIEYFKTKKAVEVSLGNRILRAETAAIVLAGTIVNTI